ncbi:MAG: hypothetical protein ACI9PD_001569 [Psychrobacter glaciei]|jgi:hypothetical protein
MRKIAAKQGRNCRKYEHIDKISDDVWLNLAILRPLNVFMC